MTDIVERLRVPCACGLGLREEAADEIERLIAALEDAVETLEAVGLHGDNPLYNRLRAALENKP